MWFGTRDGLNRYDGFNFKIYKNIPNDSNSLSDNEITSIFEDKYGFLWLGTLGGGINKYNRKHEHFHHYFLPKNGTAGNIVYSIYEDNRGILWIGTDDNILLYNRESDFFTTVKFWGENYPCSAKCIFQDKKGNYWIAAKNGLFNMDINKKNTKIFHHEPKNKNSLSSDNIRNIIEDKFGILWIGTEDGGLNKYDRKTNTFSVYKNIPNDKNSISGNSIKALKEDSDGRLWIGTIYALDLYDPKVDKFIHYKNDYLNPESLSDDYINCIYEDKSRTLWFGTWSWGLNKYSKYKNKFKHIRKEWQDKNTLTDNYITSIYEDRDENLWIGAYEGLNRYNKKTGIFYNYDIIQENKKIRNSILSIIDFTPGNILLGTFTGVKKLGISSEKITHFFPVVNSSEYAHYVINSMVNDEDGSQWIGTESAGLYKYNAKRKTSIKYQYNSQVQGSISCNKINIIFKDLNGTKWIGTTNGLNQYMDNRDSFIHFLHDASDKNSLSNNNVTSICEDQNRIIWLGTSGGGLSKLNKVKNNFTNYNEKQGLSSDVIKGMIADDSGYLWISTNKGLSKFNTETEVFRNYASSDGLLGSEYYIGSFYKSKNGEMFLGGNAGINRFFPEKVLDNPYKPSIIITAFKKFNEEVTFSKDMSEIDQIELLYNDDFFSFEFSALDFVNPEKNQFAYKLEGFDTSWIYTGTRRYASFTNIDGGEYIFRVIGSNSDGVWNKEGTSIKIIVAFPPWKRWWAYVLYALFFMAITYTIVVIRTRIQQRKIIESRKREKILSDSKIALVEHMKQSTVLQEEERYRVSRELHDGINPVLAEIKKSMNRLLQDTSIPTESVNKLTGLNGIIQNLINEVKVISYQLRPADLDRFGLLVALKNYFDNYMNNYDIGITFDWELSDQRLRSEIESHIFRIIQEALNNIQKYAEASLVEVKFTQNNGIMEITIKDDGKGCDLIKAVSKNSYGLKNMKERANFFNGEFFIISIPGEGLKSKSAPA